MEKIPSHRSSETRSLDRALLIARLLATNLRLGWRLSDLAKASGLELATTHRLLRGLLEARMAFRIPGTRRYTLGALAFELGLATRPHHDIGRLAGSALSSVAKRLRGTLYVMSWSGSESVCLVRQEGLPAPPGLMLEVGGRRPLIQTAGGLAILFALPAAEQVRMLDDNRRSLESRDRALLTGIERMMARSSAAGYALNLGDVVPGINATAVPVTGDTSRVLGSIAFAQACPVWDAQRIADIRAALLDLAPQLCNAWIGLRY